MPPATQSTTSVPATSTRAPVEVTPDSLGACALISETNAPLRDVRMAVTMVGGVSLAIYEYGVAQELFRMVHGAGIYALIKRATQSHAYVDVLSGTSAGGINGICLATALANLTDLSSLRETWVARGGIDALLHDPDTFGNAEGPPTTFLRGDGYYFPVLNQQFQELVYNQGSPLVRPGTGTDGAVTGKLGGQPTLPSGFRVESDQQASANYFDVDLFVTGTSLEGLPRAFFDRRNRPIYTLDHNAVFHFQHRARRKESHLCPDLSEPSPGIPGLSSAADVHPPCVLTCSDIKLRRRAVANRLARVARTTSSLPAIFEPSGVRPEDMNGIIPLPGTREVNWFFDGGLLNNRPLDLALDEIYRRPTTREVTRKIVFVEPVADALTVLKKGSAPARPNALQAGLFSGSVVLGQSLTGCLRDLIAFNASVDRVRLLLDAARGHATAGEEWDPCAEKVDNDPCAGERTERRDLWRNLSIQTLGDHLAGIWRKALALDPAGDLITSEADGGDSLASFDQRAGNDAIFGAILGEVRRELKQDCQIEPRRPADLSSSDVPSEGKYYLDEICFEALQRRIDRARYEITHFLFKADRRASSADNGSDVSDVSNTSNTSNTSNNASVEGELQEENPSARSKWRRAARVAAEYNTLIDDGVEWKSGNTPVQERLRDLMHLRDLSEILGGNIASVVAAVTRSEEYLTLDKVVRRTPLPGATDPIPTLAAAERVVRDHKDLVHKVWLLLVRALRVLLYDDGTILLPGTGAPASAEGRRKEAETFKESLEQRAIAICDDLIVPPGQRQILKLEEPLPAAPLLTSRLCDRVDGIVGEIAFLCRTPLLDVKVKPAEAFAWGRKIVLASGDLPPNEASTWKRRGDLAGCWLQILDEYLFPIEYAAGMPARETVELIHITPRDVQLALSEQSPQNKLSGDELGNLSGFLKRSWRANDILWGRLDAVGALADTLVDGGRLCELCAAGGTTFSEALLATLDVFISLGDSTWVPPASGGVSWSAAAAAEREQKEDALGRLLWPAYDKNLRAPLKTALDEAANQGDTLAAERARTLLRDALLLRAQHEILAAEVPIALAEAVAEAAEWQAQGASLSPTPLGPASGPASLLPVGDASMQPAQSAQSAQSVQSTAGQEVRMAADQTVDPAELTDVGRSLFAEARSLALTPGIVTDGSIGSVRTLALREKVRLLFRRPGIGASTNADIDQPDPALLYRFFREEYAIGAEKVLRDIPPVVTVRRGVRAVVIALQIIEGILRSSGSPGPLRAVGRLVHFLLLLASGIYHFLGLLARGSRVALAVHAIAWVLVLLGPILCALQVIAPNFRGAVLFVSGMAAFLEVALQMLRGDTAGGAATLAVGVGAALITCGLFASPDGTHLFGVTWADGPLVSVRVGMVLLFVIAPALWGWRFAKRSSAAASEVPSEDRWV